MLSHVFIKNFAIIKEIDLDLESGLNIITGETGTGKSIVIQAVNTAMGGRGSTSLIANGADKALVQLVFTLNDSEREKIRDFSSFIQDDELIISREFNRSGKSMARVNGEIVTLGVLSRLASNLIDIHGQYDNQAFLNPDNHRAILDNYGGNKITNIREKLSEKYTMYHSIRSELIKMRSNHAEFLRKQDFMRFEVNEIDNASLIPGEDSELADHLRFLQNAEKIYSNLSECYDIISSSNIDRTIALMSDISDMRDDFAAISQNLNDCVYSLEDLCEEIRRTRDSVSFSADDIDITVNRLNLIDNMKRKYGGSIENILEYRAKCAEELNVFENTEEREKELISQLSHSKKELISLCETLSELRKEAALSLSEKMTSELQALNFANAKFDISISHNTAADGAPVLSSEGYDKIEFMFNANKGGVLRPLAEVASGGEISRIALAFNRITNDSENVTTLIFDEIDTGISGITASVVGRKLREIAANHQILCITHLPQIAAYGNHQYLISRNDDATESYTTIKYLDNSERIHEIARLLGGSNITETTLASAEELLQFSENH